MKPAIKLDAEATYRAIENAIRTQAQVVLNSRALPETTINGYLISGDESALLVEVTGGLSVPVERILDVRFEARLYCGQHYQFSTVVRVAPRWSNSRSLAIARPRVVTVIDRRRSLRAKLAPSTSVTLEWKRAGGANRHVAAMLNISVDGMACRVDDEIADAIETEDPIYVSFQLPGLDHRFDLCANLSNRTPASTGCIILGLHFVSTPEVADELAALREALSDPQTISADSEVCV